MSEATDPTFYRSPREAIAAPAERLAYVAAYDPAGHSRDAITVVDCDPSSASYGTLVGWSQLPTAGNELHHFGWNACSSALCHQSHGGHGNGVPLERRYLIVPGIRSSRTYVLDTKPDPRAPRVVREIEADELASKAGYSRPHTVHCGPGAIFMSALGGAEGNDGPGGVALLNHDTFDVIGPWELDRGEQFFAYDVWWHLNYDTVITSEWGTPSMFEQGLNNRLRVRALAPAPRGVVRLRPSGALRAMTCRRPRYWRTLGRRKAAKARTGPPAPRAP
jgi:selenium-binding protein 1